ncbi:MAG: helix-turn-helix transcriptional regulator [Acidobacteria bacterium]|nr:helix-turn-helix transcriptional regulator [Acidobacteriota bacterium]
MEWLSHVSVADPTLHDGDCGEVRDFVAVFANRLRLKLLCRLAEGPACVHELVEATGDRQSNVSQQLKILHEADFVRRRRVGARVYYEIDNPVTLEVLDFLMSVAQHPDGWTHQLG